MVFMSASTGTKSPIDIAKEEMEKAHSLVEAGLRMLEDGNMVDMSALGGRIATICTVLDGLDKTTASPLLPNLERLMIKVIEMEKTLRQRLD